MGEARAPYAGPMRIQHRVLTSLLLGASIASATAGVEAAPETQPMRFELSAPGYVHIDDRWYVFDEASDGSSGARSVRLHTLGRGVMFLHGWISARSCASAALGATPPPARLGAGETFGTQEVVVPLEIARADIFSCDGVLTLAARSPRGDVRCNNPIPPPFTAQQCPALRALPPVGGIFRSGFEN